MKNRYFWFEVYRKKFIVIFIIILSIFSTWYLNQSSQLYQYHLYNAFPLEQTETIDYSSYLEKEITLNKKTNANSTELKFNQYLLDHHITPLNIGLEFNHIGVVNGAAAIYTSIKEITPLMLPFISLVLAMYSFQKEKSSYHYLMTLPIKKESIINAKIFSSIFVSSLSVLTILFVSFIKGFMMGGVGEFQYPILLNISHINTSFQYIPLWLFIILSFILMIIQITVYTFIGHFIIRLIQNKWLTYFITIGISLLPIIYMLTSHQPLYTNDPITFIPFVNESVFYIITYGFSPIFLIIYYGILVLSMLVLYKINLVMFKKEYE